MTGVDELPVTMMGAVVGNLDEALVVVTTGWVGVLFTLLCTV